MRKVNHVDKSRDYPKNFWKNSKSKESCRAEKAELGSTPKNFQSPKKAAEVNPSWDAKATNWKTKATCFAELNQFWFCWKGTFLRAVWKADHKLRIRTVVPTVVTRFNSIKSTKKRSKNGLDRLNRINPIDLDHLPLLESWLGLETFKKEIAKRIAEDTVRVSKNVTRKGFEPLPFRTGTLNQRLRPLDHLAFFLFGTNFSPTTNQKKDKV